MRAPLPRSNIEVEGEPAEIAQLAQLLQDGAVMVEHVHRWRIPDSGDEQGMQRGACACGAEKQFAPWGADGATPAAREAKAPTGKRKCGKCGKAGHTAPSCGAK